MTNIRFDHFLTYTSATNIDDYLKEYAAQGFLPHENTVRHEPGLRNGFIALGPEYLEFCWVEDETLFAAAEGEEGVLRTARRPFGLGLIADDVQAVHDDWTARGYAVPDVRSKAPRDATPDTPPAWSFQEIPSDLLPGVFSFALTYHTRSKAEVIPVQIPPNTIYALSGVTFVATEPEARATRWRNLLAPSTRVHQSAIGVEVWIGPHRALWMTSEVYEASYRLPWRPAAHSAGELALLHLLASDVSTAKMMMAQSGRRTYSILVEGEEHLVIAPDTRDGFTFIIRQQPVELWLKERIVRTGEKLKLIHD